MNTPRLSVIIPSHNDIYLHKTIASLLDNADETIEVIVVLDGYKPKYPIVNDRRVRVLKHEENRGMRDAINTGVAASNTPYIMRTDEHCMFGPRFDRLLLEHVEPSWIVTPRRYKLDPVRWKVMSDRPIDYEKLVIKDPPGKFSGVEWVTRGKERRHIAIDETMMMQGSCWLMPRCRSSW